MASILCCNCVTAILWHKRYEIVNLSKARGVISSVISVITDLKLHTSRNASIHEHKNV